MQPRWVALLLVVAAGICAISAYSVYEAESAPAKNDKIYLDYTQNVYARGDSIHVAVRIATKQPVDTATATVRYDNSAVEYVATKYSTEQFDSQLPAITAEDTVTVQAARLGGATVTGDVVFATLTFTAKERTAPKFIINSADAARAGTSIEPYFATVSLGMFWILIVSTGLLCAGALVVALYGPVVRFIRERKKQ